MRNSVYVVAGTLVSLMASAAWATPSDSIYISGGGGVSLAHDADITGNNINTEADYDAGYAVIGAVGKSFQEGFRVELELGYRENDVGSVGDAARIAGDTHAATFIGNVLYDIHNQTPFTPYAGAGLGVARLTYDGVSPVGGSRIEDINTLPVLQGIIGARYDIAENWGVFADYRYLTDIDSNNVHFTTDSGVKVEGEYTNSTFLAGIQYRFGEVKRVPQPEKKAAPVSRATASRSYLAFFDFDKSELTPEAQEIIRKAWEDAGNGEVVRIELTGHADRAGTDRYNIRLSERRSQAVKRELVRLGASAQDIVTFAKGETDPLVPTDDGVREPQNRRVEIVYTR